MWIYNFVCIYLTVYSPTEISAYAKDSTLFNAQVEKNINFIILTTWVEDSLIKLSQDILRESRINPDKKNSFKICIYLNKFI